MGLFRSKSCTIPESPPPYDSEEEEDAMEEEEAHTEYVRLRRSKSRSCTDISDSSPFNHLPLLSIVLNALRKSLLLTCSVDTHDVVIGDDLDIGWPIDASHLHHVTFDPFHGFSGLPVELQAELPSKVPSASMNVFGISANSMKWADDGRGNSVPTTLLMLQERLYSEGGLHEEGIFRINAENGQDEYVRSHLSEALLPSHHIDVHCLAGLIKAWFRELPVGVLDSLTPDQVMHCNTEEECTQLVKLLPPTEAQLLDWAINLMADVVLQVQHNKMNSRNIAMVFAPNMTQMADPLTALIHAVQVMNLLKTLVDKTIRERESRDCLVSSPAESPDHEEIESAELDEMMKCMETADVLSGSEKWEEDGTLECVELCIEEGCSYGVKKGDENEVDEALRKVSVWTATPENILSRSQSMETRYRDGGLKSNDEAGIQARSADILCFQLNNQMEEKAGDGAISLSGGV